MPPDRPDTEGDLIGELLDSNRFKGALGKWLGAGLAITIGALIYVAVSPAPRPETVYLQIPDDGSRVQRILSGQPMDFQERTIRGELFSYINACESYVYETVKTSHNDCALHSTGKRRQEYEELFDGSDSPIRKYGSDTVVRVVPPITIELTTKGQARVSFSTATTVNRGQPKVKGWVALIGYSFLPQAVMSQSDMLVNYSGFVVSSYTVTAVTQ